MFKQTVHRIKTVIGLMRVFGVREASNIIWDRLAQKRRVEKRIIVPACVSELKCDFCLSSNWVDCCTFLEVIVHKEYKLSENLNRLIDGKPIIDIGANIGAAAVYFANSYPNSPILAIEPHPRNVDFIRENSAPYSDSVTVIEKAFSVNPGTVTLANPEVEVKQQHNSYLFSTNLACESEDAIRVRSITPEEILSISQFSKEIGLLKVDIEGAEKEIFESPQIDQLLSITDVLAIETHDRLIPGCTNAVMDAAKRNGLKLFKQKGDVLFFTRLKSI